MENDQLEVEKPSATWRCTDHKVGMEADVGSVETTYDMSSNLPKACLAKIIGRESQMVMPFLYQTEWLRRDGLWRGQLAGEGRGGEGRKGKRMRKKRSAILMNMQLDLRHLHNHLKLPT